MRIQWLILNFRRNDDELGVATKLSVQATNSAIKVLFNDDMIREITGNKRNRIFVLSDYINIFK